MDSAQKEFEGIGSTEVSDKMYDIIGGDGEEYGPVSRENLNDYLLQGRVNLQTLVKENGTEDEWRPLSEILDASSNQGFDEFRQAILDSPNRLSIGRAFGDGWSVFTSHMGIMVGAGLLFLLINIGTSIVPIIGGFIQLAILGPLTGGLFILILRLIRTDSARISDMFEGFENNFGKLCLVGIAQWFIGFVAMVPGIVLVVIAAIASASGVDFESSDGGAIFFESLITHPLTYIGFIAFISVMWVTYVGIYFVLPLAADKKFGFFQCFSLGIRVSMRNFIPISLVYILGGILGGIVIVISCLPLLLGLIFSLPWFYAVITQAYVQMFIPEPATNEY